MSIAKERVPLWVHNTLVPLFLLVVCPPTVFVFWYINTALGGSFATFWQQVYQFGLFQTLAKIWGPVCLGNATAWKMIGSYALFQLILMRVVPGKPFLGPVTPKGNVPVYKANGFACYLITFTVFLIASVGLGWFSPTIIFDEMGPMLGALNVFSLCFCLFLYIKGRTFPSSSDHGITGNVFFDYYWGSELYPRIFGWDVKQFTNCRFGMMGWGLILLSYAAKQHQLYGLSDSMVVSVVLQLLYISKFFWWEPGYLRSLDIMHDRAGFYICWGCLVWLPCIYTSPSQYLVHNPIHLGWPLASLIFLGGVLSVSVNYLADRQRQVVRAKNGACLVWRQTPILIEAPYITENGEAKKTILLASGWWGLSRHFHYIPEILASFFWSMPALFTNFMPYFYTIYLTILLVDRAFRHDKRCADKYGAAWDAYCNRVQYKLIPYVF